MASRWKSETRCRSWRNAKVQACTHTHKVTRRCTKNPTQMQAHTHCAQAHSHTHAHRQTDRLTRARTRTRTCKHALTHARTLTQLLLPLYCFLIRSRLMRMATVSNTQKEMERDWICFSLLDVVVRIVVFRQYVRTVLILWNECAILSSPILYVFFLTRGFKIFKYI